MMSVGATKCNHCKLDFDGDDLDYFDDKGYCYDCMAKLGRAFGLAYAQERKDNAEDEVKTANALIAYLKDGAQ